jgi:hypothetical protein
MEVVQKLKFPNNSIVVISGVYYYIITRRAFLLFGTGNADKFCNIVVFCNLDIHLDSIYFFSEGFFCNLAGADLRFDKEYSGRNGVEPVFCPVSGAVFSKSDILKRFLGINNYSLDT